MNMSSSEDSKRFSVVEIIESFITKINRIQKTLVGISISSLILAPMAIGLSIYLILHPHFFFILDEYDEEFLPDLSLLGHDFPSLLSALASSIEVTQTVSNGIISSITKNVILLFIII